MHTSPLTLSLQLFQLNTGKMIETYDHTITHEWTEFGECSVWLRQEIKQDRERSRNGTKEIHFIRIELNKFIFLSLQCAEPSALHSWHSNIKHSFWHSIGVITVVSNYVTVNHHPPPTRSKIYIAYIHSNRKKKYIYSLKASIIRTYYH